MSAGVTNAVAGGGGLTVIASGSTSGNVSFPSPAAFVLVSSEYFDTSRNFQIVGVAAPGQTAEIKSPTSFSDTRTFGLSSNGLQLTVSNGEIDYIALG